MEKVSLAHTQAAAFFFDVPDPLGAQHREEYNYLQVH